MVRIAKTQRSRARRALTGILGAALCVATGAHAADDPVILSWSVPIEADCPDATYALREIRRHLGPAPNERKPVRASVAIRAIRAGLYQMVLKTEQDGAEGERTLSDASCEAVADAAIVVLAWMIDPNSVSGPAREPTRAARLAAPESAAPPAMVPPMPPRRAPAWSVALGPLGDVGTLPAVAFGIEASVATFVRPLGVAAYGAYWPPSSTTAAVLPDGRTAGGDFTLWALGIHACLQVPWGSRADAAGLSFCAGPELDVMKGRGFGVSTPSEGTKSWVAATAGLRAAAPLGGAWRASLAVTGIFPARRERFSIEGVGEVHRPASAAARAGLDVELAF